MLHISANGATQPLPDFLVEDPTGEVLSEVAMCKSMKRWRRWQHSKPRGRHRPGGADSER